MTREILRPVVIVVVLVALLGLNAREFNGKRRTLQTGFASAPTADAALSLARQQALQALTIEQLLHMIHTMLAAILAALLWR